MCEKLNILYVSLTNRKQQVCITIEGDIHDSTVVQLNFRVNQIENRKHHSGTSKYLSTELKFADMFQEHRIFIFK